MDIKTIYCMLEKITEGAKCELDEKGINGINAEEFGKVTDMIKDLAEAMYYRTLTVAMEESEYGEDYDENGPMEERKYYRGQPRDSRGRYMSRRGRRGYEDAMYEMTPEMYHMYPAEHYRDMDKANGRMYYSGGGSGGQNMGTGGTSSGSSSGGRYYGGERYYSGEGEGGNYSSRNQQSGRSGESRRGYMETKEMNKGNTPEEKQAKMKELEKYMKDLSEDVTEMISDASPEEKTLLKQKMSVLMQKL